MANSTKPKVLIPFYSRSGTIERLAKAVAEGAQSEGAEVRLLVFGTRQVLERLRKFDRLHDARVQVLVAVDGDVFTAAWGLHAGSGSLAGSRASNWGDAPSAPNGGIGLRCVRDHLILV